MALFSRQPVSHHHAHHGPEVTYLGPSWGWWTGTGESGPPSACLPYDAADDQQRGQRIQCWDDDHRSLQAALIWTKGQGIRWIALPGQAVPLTSATMSHMTLDSHVMEEAWYRAA